MRITDITPETESQYLCCLEEWSEDMKEAGDCKKKWYDSMKNKGLKVKFVEDDNGIIAGMIQYIPIEYSMFVGKNLYVVLCIWIHGHKQGRGDYRKRGMGTLLLKAAEDDSRQLGANGLVTWGLIIPVFMKASWFKKKGYKVVDKSGITRLLWKPFNENALPPKFNKLKKKPEKGTGKVNVSIFQDSWCQSMNITCERVRRAALDFPGKVNIQEYDPAQKEVMQEWGISGALFIDGKEIPLGPPITYNKIRKKIEKRVSRVS